MWQRDGGSHDPPSLARAPRPVLRRGPGPGTARQEYTMPTRRRTSRNSTPNGNHECPNCAALRAEMATLRKELAKRAELVGFVVRAIRAEARAGGPRKDAGKDEKVSRL